MCLLYIIMYKAQRINYMQMDIKDEFVSFLDRFLYLAVKVCSNLLSVKCNKGF
jgi:hypothetical protein